MHDIQVNDTLTFNYAICTLMVWVFTSANSYLPDEINLIHLNEISTQICLRNNNYVRRNSSFSYSWFKKLTSVRLGFSYHSNTSKHNQSETSSSTTKCEMQKCITYTALTSAPRATNNWTMFWWPEYVAWNRAVQPFLSFASMLAPLCHKHTYHSPILCVCVCHSRIIS